MVKLRAAILISITVILFTVGVRVWSDSAAPVVTLPASTQREVALAVLRTTGYGVTHSQRDDLTPNHILAARIEGGEDVQLTCGYVSALSVDLLAQVGIESRRVMMLTKAEYDGNNGHTAMETSIGGEWYFTDPDFGRLYHQTADSLRAGRGEWTEIGEQYADPEDPAVYPRHVDNGVVGIEDGDHVVFDCEDMRPDLIQHVLDYAPNYYQCLAHDEWIERFYGQD